MKLEVRYRPYRGTGAGGQHRNTTMSDIEANVTLPDGRVIKATASGRSQAQNKAAALKVLRARVQLAMAPGATERYRAGQERIRTYHEPDNRVVDHASGKRWSYGEVVGQGDLSGPIEARREHLLMAADSPA